MDPHFVVPHESDMSAPMAPVLNQYCLRCDVERQQRQLAEQAKVSGSDDELRKLFAAYKLKKQGWICAVESHTCSTYGAELSSIEKFQGTQPVAKACVVDRNKFRRLMPLQGYGDGVPFEKTETLEHEASKDMPPLEEDEDTPPLEDAASSSIGGGGSSSMQVEEDAASSSIGGGAASSSMQVRREWNEIAGGRNFDFRIHRGSIFLRGDRSGFDF